MIDARPYPHRDSAEQGLTEITDSERKLHRGNIGALTLAAVEHYTFASSWTGFD
jgi:hypothetical protein